MNVAHGGAPESARKRGSLPIIERNGTEVAFVCRTSVGTPEMAATVDTPGVARYPVHTLYEAPSRGTFKSGSAANLNCTRKASIVNNSRKIYQEDEDAGDCDRPWHSGPLPFQVYPGAGAGEVEVMEYQMEMGRYAIDCGADMVVGHHPHEPQPIESYKGKGCSIELDQFRARSGEFRAQRADGVARTDASVCD